MDDDSDDLEKFGLDKTSSHLRHPTRSVGASGELDVQPSAAKQHEGWLAPVQGNFLSYDDIQDIINTNKSAPSPDYTRKQPLKPKVDHQARFGPMVVAPGQTGTMSYRSPCLFRGEDLVCSGESDGVDITGVWVGDRAQIPMGIPSIAAGTFKSSVLNSGIKLVTAVPGVDISISVVNRSNTPRLVQFDLLGSAVW